MEKLKEVCVIAIAFVLSLLTGILLGCYLLFLFILVGLLVFCLLTSCVSRLVLYGFSL